MHYLHQYVPRSSSRLPRTALRKKRCPAGSNTRCEFGSVGAVDTLKEETYIGHPVRSLTQIIEKTTWLPSLSQVIVGWGLPRASHLNTITDHLHSSETFGRYIAASKLRTKSIYFLFVFMFMFVYVLLFVYINVFVYTFVFVVYLCICV